MSEGTGRLRHVEHVMGTAFSFDVRGEPAPEVAQALAGAVDWLHRMDAMFSTYRPDSQICRLDRGETTPRACDPEVREVLELCGEAARATGGWFTAWPAGRLDPSAMVKGWAVERASSMLYEAGARDHMVNGGGDIQCRGESAPGRPWRIGIAHPFRRGGLSVVVDGCHLAVATSGTTERGDHIIDPIAGTPATELASLTLVGRHLTEVDALATAAFAMGEKAGEWVAARPGIEGYAVRADGGSWWSAGFPAYCPGITPVAAPR
ncbi:FAD:protein FMN transferase [Streptomyces sp. NPDC127084]|uniref:FAD:protein FMN transferase n=1 Tax=Streptomyces sp. NPDC127084 TaxID=3347133 RepID=UPI00365CDA4F